MNEVNRFLTFVTLTLAIIILFGALIVVLSSGVTL